MKTRIISGIIMGIIVIAVISLGMLVHPAFITVFLSLVAAVGCYELLHNAAGITSKSALIGSCVYVAVMVFSLDLGVSLSLEKTGEANIDYLMGALAKYERTLALTIIYFLFTVIIVLKKHSKFSLSKIGVLCGMPFILAFAFSFMVSVINHEKGLYYLLLLLNFSSLCDMGAYFVGVTVGKHKLCPEISPKKTIEGSLGGIVTSLLFTVIISLSFKTTAQLPLLLIFTVPLCIVGMMGDLFASAIKRAAEIKDFGALIPGHGGVLDRVDSILLIAPVLYMLISVGVI